MRESRGLLALDNGSLPRARYVAVIADGSRRWARGRGLPVLAGHQAAADTVWARAHDALDLGIHELTVFCFSTENWQRPPEEVTAWMELGARCIAEDTYGLAAQGVQIRFIGTREGLPAELTEQMDWAERFSASSSKLKLFLAFNYGGRREIEDAARRFGGSDGSSFRECLYAPDMHDPDLVIRTGGDRRLSNFLLWRMAYSELVFRDELWPEFTRECFDSSLFEFAGRRRRFGGD